MIKKIWQRFVGSRKEKPRKAVKHQLVKLTRDSHNLSRRKVSKNALKVLYRLNDAGYQSFLVGGGVRDILLGLSPKDFDIATDATPEQVRGEFKNCRLVGRRFRLAHVLFGREVIEVATFRASHDDACQSKAKTSHHGMLMRDNVYGSLEEDAFRRDFTVNALYYSVKDFCVLDYVGGLADLEKRQLRLIGDPVARYQEDPVRILRAIRLSAKLNLAIETTTAAPISDMASLLAHVSPARLWDEVNKLFLSGYGLAIWKSLKHYQVIQYLFEQTHHSLKKDLHGAYDGFIERALKNTDLRIEQDQPVTPAFLFAVLLWQPQLQLTQKLIQSGMPSFEASQKAANKVFDQQVASVAIPKRFSIMVKEIWSLQFRLENRKKKNVDSLIENPKFRAAYDFLCLRAGDDPQLGELADWWTEFQQADSEKRLALIDQCGQPLGNKPKRQGKRRGPRKNMRHFQHKDPP